MMKSERQYTHGKDSMLIVKTSQSGNFNLWTKGIAIVIIKKKKF